jgi:hypothetical protein
MNLIGQTLDALRSMRRRACEASRCAIAKSQLAKSISIG